MLLIIFAIFFRRKEVSKIKEGKCKKMKGKREGKAFKKLVIYRKNLKSIF